AVGTHEPAYLVVTNRAVVLVREHDDRDQRVRTQELFTLLEQDVVTARAGAERAVFVHHQGGATHRGRTLLGDIRWRLGVDQEAVPRLERRFPTAAIWSWNDLFKFAALVSPGGLFLVPVASQAKKPVPL